MNTRRIVVGVAGLTAMMLVMIGCGGASGQPKTAPTAKSAACDGKKEPINDPLLDSLSLLATNAPRDTKKYPSVKTDADLERYIDALIEDPRFSEVVAPEIVIPKIMPRIGGGDMPLSLRLDTSGPTPIYYLRKKCDLAKAEDVHPWWALDTVVKVCPDAHQPDRLKIPNTREDYCGVTKANPACGCGPNVAFCARDSKQRDAIVQSLKREMVSLVTRVVATNAPVDEMFLTNETERDRNVEYVYRRWRISSGEPATKVLADLAQWPETPIRAPRTETTPHQHAGILTVAGAIGIEGSRRARMKWFYDAMWCDEPPGGTVNTEAILALPHGDLRDLDGWKELAAKPVCTDCHARLDYGANFFTGFATSYAYDPSFHLDGRGKLYGRDIKDERGEGELTPLGFAKLAVAQREFPACIVRDVKRRVFVDPLNTADDATLQDAFKQGHSLKKLMSVALRRYADHERARACEQTQAAHVSGETLDAMMQTYCATCHGPKRQPDFRTAKDPVTLKRALAQVAFGNMPRAPMAMPSDARSEMVELLIRRLWSDPAMQADARAYFGEQRPLPVHTVAGLLATVDQRAGAPSGVTAFDRVPERRTTPDLLTYSHGVAVIVHFEALQACKAAGHTGEKLSKCVEDATDVSESVRTAGDR